MNGKTKALLSSALVIGMVAAVAGSGVFAAIRDVESSRQNVLEGGSLDLKTDGGDGTTTFAVRDVKPCPHPRCEGEGRDILENIGENPGELSISVPEVTNAPGVTFEPEPRPDEGELGANAEIAIYLDENNDGEFNGNDTGLSAQRVDDPECWQYAPVTLQFDTINSYEGCQWTNVTELTPGEQDGFEVHWRVPSDTGSEIMDDQVFTKFGFELVQIQSSGDSLLL